MVELLAPAGNKECFLAALCAGADAVYIGGDRFGARAYADNFSSQDVIWAIDTAHLYHRKLYLTVNTLLKASELTQLTGYLKPFYEAGLDGVIVQDFGALSVMQGAFPDLEIHASTQMTVTGSMGASLLKEAGVCRVVPARELSLDEIIQIKKDTGLSIETFIHGAMCYSYSGQCLFSSMLGGRSGNRGRCAGPCRLPYKVYCDGKQLNNRDSLYQLSLKDLCSLDILPQLIEAGIDSFKIEGRMKSKEYVACVTQLYRKYIDVYLAEPQSYQVAQSDKKKIQDAFSRGSIETGYYFLHNGRQLVTLKKPGYQSFAREEAAEDGVFAEQSGASGANGAAADKGRFSEADSLADKNRAAGVKQQKDSPGRPGEIPLAAYFTACKGKEMTLTVISEDGNGISAFVKGAVVEQSVSRPAHIEDVKKALLKTGNTVFAFRSIEVEMDEDVFLPNKQLNELRREALKQFTETALADYRRQFDEDNAFLIQEETNAVSGLSGVKGRLSTTISPVDNTGKKTEIHLAIQTLEQFLSAVPVSAVKRIYISFDLFLEMCHIFDVRAARTQSKRIKQTDIKANIRLKMKAYKEMGIAVFLALGAVVRRQAVESLQLFHDLIVEFSFDGFLINNLESLQYMRVTFPDARLVSDSRFYIMQPQAEQFLERYGISEHVLSYELHEKEIRGLVDAGHLMYGKHSYILPVYGYIPVMETAGCVLRTNEHCQKGKDAWVELKDRQNKSWHVIRHCDRCENTIYNAYPLSLHTNMKKIASIGVTGVMLSFTRETAAQMNRLICWYAALLSAACDNRRTDELLSEAPFSDFTKGHFAKGVE